MPPWPDYELLDFGDGRKLERIGGLILDRPSPAATGTPGHSNWSHADARFEKRGERGRWRCAATLTETWCVRWRQLVLELRRSPVGHIGVFPEQVANWQWLTELKLSGLRVLNLFAYTGGSTLAAALAGAAVTHVDAAKNIVARARLNAEASSLAALPIRWIAEDARKFVTRELRRGNFYDAVILDPPSYGHGPKGQSWNIDRDLPELLEACGELTRFQPLMTLLTCHSPGYEASRLRRELDRLGQDCSATEAGELRLQTKTQRHLPSGHFARYARGL